MQNLSLVACTLLLGLPVQLASAQLASRTNSSGSQTKTGSQTQNAPHRTRLYLRDGSYQVVMSYTLAGTRVKFVSAERAGESEEIPLELVDLDATRRWEQKHPAQEEGVAEDGRRAAPAIDPELAREEAERATLAPEIAPDLRLAPEDSVLAFDTYRGTPELVPLMQSQGDLNRQTGHSILRATINPLASSHQVLQLKGEKSSVQMHVPDPEFYIRVADDTASTGAALTVDTHGASSSVVLKDQQKTPSRYAIVRAEVRQDARVLASFNTSVTGSTKRQQEVVETFTTTLPGGHWMKIVPRESLLFGEYCLVEVLGEKEINLSVWDFGVHPTAPENRDVLRPEKRRAGALERRGRD